MALIKPGGIDDLGIVLPGDKVMDYNPDNKNRIYIGPGLRWEKKAIYASKAGLLKKSQKNVYFIYSEQKRYIPQKREYVIGIVIKKRGDTFVIDIGASENATISYLSFENASKKTRTEMELGDLIYGRLLVANKDMEPELICIDKYDRAVGMGLLPKGGILFTVPIHVCRILLKPDNPFLLNISKKINYTLVVGFNGRVWVKTDKQRETTILMNCIEMLEIMSLEEANKNVLRLIDNLSVHKLEQGITYELQ